MYETVSGFSGSVILRNQPLKFPILQFWIWQAAENAESFAEKYLKISQQLHGGDRKHIRYVRNKS